MLNFEQIKEILPQRFPYLMIDRVLELEPKKRIVAIKNITGNEICFLGHFPDQSITPGTLLVEIMAQAGIILFAMSEKCKSGKKPTYYMGKITARFYHPVYPGDQIRVEGIMAKFLSTGGFFETKMYVGEKMVSKAELVFSVKK